MSASHDKKMLYFAMLTREEQVAAIKRLVSSGMSDYGVAAACGLSVEMIRSIIGQRGACDGCTDE
jgi:hypothetical protein